MSEPGSGSLVDTTALEVRRLSLSDALQVGAECWDARALAAATPSVFMSWAWHVAWLEATTPEERAASFVLAAGPDTSPSIIVPFCPRRVEFHRIPVHALTMAADNLATPDHLDALVQEPADVTSLVDPLAAIPWDALILRSVADHAPYLGALVGEFERRGLRVVRDRAWPCVVVPLPESWDVYLAGLSEKRRYRIRKDERTFAKRHGLHVTWYEGNQVVCGWEHLVRLCEARWHGRGTFSTSPQVAMLFRRFATESAGQGRLWLASLDVDGMPVAAEFAVRFGDTLFGLLAGRDPTWDSESVGRVLRAVMMRRAIEAGLKQYDLSRGTDPHKYEWTSTERLCHQITVLRPGRLGTMLFGAHLLALACRRLTGRAETRVEGRSAGDRRG